LLLLSTKPASHQAVELTTDHQIDTNPLERERLLRDHPDEDDVIRHNRVKGRLQPTRGLGDGFYKRRDYYNARSLSRPYSHWTPPYTTAEPDITEYTLHPDDEFMVMATDGLFQDLHSQQVVELVGQWIDTQRAEEKRKAGSLASRTFGSPAPGYLPNAATFLIRSALQHASEARFGRRRKENENLSLVLQLPSDKKRNFHDDVSVVVLFFDQSASANFPADDPVALPTTGPPVPPTLARAIAAHLKAPHTGLQNPLPTNGGVVPIRMAPLQDNNGSSSSNSAGATGLPSDATSPIRSNL
jgi:pyruvate dehydrogenase phosphatase